MGLKLTLRHDKWQIHGTITLADGTKRRVRKATGFRRSQRDLAETALAQAALEVKSGAEPSVGKAPALRDGELTLGDAVSKYINRPNPPGKTDQGVLSRLARGLGPRIVFHEIPLKSFTDYVNGRGNSVGTVAREMTSINALISSTRANGYLAPTYLLDKPKFDDSRTRWLTAKERDRFIECFEPGIRRLVTFLFFTGARLSEASNLKWNDIIGGRAHFVSKKGRNRKLLRRAVKLSPQAVEAAGTRRVGLVFTNQFGKPWTKDAVAKAFARARRKAGIDDFRAHDCRHTFASLLVQQGAPLLAVSKLLGHTTVQMTQRYAHMAPSHEDAVIDMFAGDEEEAIAAADGDAAIDLMAA